MNNNNENYNRIQNRKDEKFFQIGFSLIFILGGISLAIYFFSISDYPEFGKNQEGETPQISFYGQFGDFIGGVVGSLFSLAGVIMLFRTLREQRDNFHIERVENNFFEMIKFQRENVNLLDFDINEELNKKAKQTNIKGRKVFYELYKQYRELYWEVNNLTFININNDIYDIGYLKQLEKNNEIVNRRISLSQLAILDITYLIFFYGLSEEGIISIKNITKGKYNQDSITRILDVISLKPVKSSRYYTKWKRNIIVSSAFPSLIDIIIEERKKGSTSSLVIPQYSYNDKHSSLMYYPYYPNNYFKYYGGHQFRLGHYYRHLFQSVKFIEKNELLTYEEKYDYIKILRGQLSTYEQIMLFFNSLSQLGRVWELEDKKVNSNAKVENAHLITKYNLIKNISSDEIIKGVKCSSFYPCLNYESYETTEYLEKRKDMESRYF